MSAAALAGGPPPAARPGRPRPAVAGLAAFAGALLLWEVVGRLGLVAGGALPAPSAVLAGLWADRADYPAHVAATLQAALAGFVVGNVAAVACGALFVLVPVAARLSAGINLVLFALPPIAVVPVLVLTTDGLTGRIILAAVGCYFPTMAATVLGLSRLDPRTVDLVRAYGGGRLAVLRRVGLRSALPTLLAGLRVAAPNAVLGAILAEFGGGARWGLGAYLLGSLGRADPVRLWGIGLVATAIAGIAYGLVALVAHRVTGATRAVTLPASAAPAGAPSRPPSRAVRLGVLAAAAALPFLAWWAIVAALGLPPLIARSPMGVVDYLFLAPGAAAAQAKLLAALAATLPVTFLGMVAGLLAALLLALACEAAPSFRRLLLPVALVTQTMPLVALTPLYVLVFGRGVAVTVAITVSVTFFPAFVTLAQGLALVPRAALDLARAYGAPRSKELALVALPAALPHLFAAARLAVPRALLGVMIAEWLATGTGLGNLLNQSRGRLDYGMIWTVAAVSVMLSAGFYGLVAHAERRTLARLGMARAD